MTSKWTLLVTLVGLAGLGCSAPEDGEDAPDAPTLPPPYRATPAAPAQTPAQQPMQNTGMLQPQPTEQQPMPQPIQQPAAMGTGGAPGAGMMGAAGAGAGALPTQLAITPTAGFVAPNTNDVGITGYFYTFNDNMDGGNTTIQPANFMMAMGSTICTSGVGAQVLNEDYESYWGGGVGLNLSDAGGTTGAQPWARGRVVGFSFNISGTQVPPAGQLRFKATFYEGATVNFDYCVNAAMGANSFRLDQIVNDCWGPATPALPPTALLEALQWQVATVTTAATPFNFCIENLTAIVQ